MTRRELFLTAATAPLAAADNPARPPLCLFSKHLPELGYDELGRTCKKLGFDGVDLTVRPKGHVLPENVARDLPKAIAALRGHGLSVPMITTGLVSPGDPAAASTFATAARLKIPRLKLGYWRYGNADILEKVAAVRKAVTGLVALAARHRVVTGFHNHSGDHVGYAVWDIHEIIRDLDPRWIGYYFDPCHATIEGGKSGWYLNLRLALKRLRMVAVKDFYWQKKDGKWRAVMCPLGEGMVDWERFFSILARARFSGPISLHVEYHPADEMSAIARDLAFLKRQVAKAYAGSV